MEPQHTPDSWLRYSKFSARPAVWLAWATLKTLFEFVSRSPLIHVVGRSFCLYTDSLFAQMGDSNDKCSSSLDVECWNEDETQAVQQSPTQFSELTKAKNLVLHSSHFVLNWRCCTVLGKLSSGGIWKFMTSSFKCYIDHSHTMYSSGNIEVGIWVNPFKTRSITNSWH